MSAVAEAARASVDGGQGVVISGPPGSGKSVLLRQLGNSGVARQVPGLSYARHRRRLDQALNALHSTMPLRGENSAHVNSRNAHQLGFICVDDIDSLGRRSAERIVEAIDEGNGRVIATSRSGGLTKLMRKRLEFRHLMVYELPRLTDDEVRQMCQQRLGGPVDSVTCLRLADAADGWPYTLQQIVEVNARGGAFRWHRGVWSAPQLTVPGWLQSRGGRGDSLAALSRFVELLLKTDSVEYDDAEQLVGRWYLEQLIRHGGIRPVADAHGSGLRIELSSGGSPDMPGGREIGRTRQVAVGSIRSSSLDGQVTEGSQTELAVGHLLLGSTPDDPAALDQDIVDVVQSAQQGRLAPLLALALHEPRPGKLPSPDGMRRRIVAAQAQAAAGSVSAVIRGLDPAPPGAPPDGGAGVVLVSAYLEVGDHTRAIELAEAIRQVGLRRRQFRCSMWGTALLGMSLLRAGQPEQAEAWLREALAIAEMDQDFQDPIVAISLATVAVCAAWRGDELSARRHAAEAAHHPAVGRSVLLKQQVELCVCEADLILGYASSVGRKAAELGAQANDAGCHAVALHAFLMAARAAGTGRTAELTSQAAEQCDYPAAALHADYALSLSCGNGTALENVSRQYLSSGWPLLAAEAASQAESRFRSAGNVTAANRCRQRAWSVLGAAGIAGPHHWLGADTSALTTREAEIAELISRGAKAQQVATELHLSRRTVENHLQRCYRKLGVSSQRELQTMMQRRQTS